MQVRQSIVESRMVICLKMILVNYYSLWLKVRDSANEQVRKIVLSTNQKIHWTKYTRMTIGNFAILFNEYYLSVNFRIR